VANAPRFQHLRKTDSARVGSCCVIPRIVVAADSIRCLERMVILALAAIQAARAALDFLARKPLGV